MYIETPGPIDRTPETPGSGKKQHKNGWNQVNIIALIMGSIIIFALGVGYLGSIIGYDKAITAGLMPFIPSELFKIALAVAIIPSLSKNFK